jgi:hypothetical protein
MFMAMKGRLKGKWWAKFEAELAQLQQTHPGHWMKLKQYIN